MFGTCVLPSSMARGLRMLTYADSQTYADVC